MFCPRKNEDILFIQGGAKSKPYYQESSLNRIKTVSEKIMLML